MRVTIIPSDGLVSIDGEGFSDIDLSSIDPSVHAVQWYDTEGEIEVKDTRGRIVENREITSFEEFDFVVPLWEAEKAKAIQEAQALADLQAQMEAQALIETQTIANTQTQQTP
jgi:hypothetical protein